VLIAGSEVAWVALLDAPVDEEFFQASETRICLLKDFVYLRESATLGLRDAVGGVAVENPVDRVADA
jgi:hypothetical protein